MSAMLDPAARVRGEEEIDYLSVLAWLFARLGEEIEVEIGSSGRLAAVSTRGIVTDGREAWPGEEAPVVFTVNGAKVSLLPRQFYAAWALEMETADGGRLDVVEVKLYDGVTLTLGRSI